MYPKEIQAKLNERAHQYAREFLAKAKTVLSQQKNIATGQLASEIKSRVIPATDSSSPVIQLIYPEYGDFIAARSAVYTKHAPPDQVLATVKSPKFRIRSIPGYANVGASNLSQEAIQKRVAFAIARSKYQGARHRRKRWKRDALTDLLNQLNESLAQDWENETANILAAAFKKN